MPNRWLDFLDWLRAQFDPGAEPVRIAVFVGLVVAGLAHRFAPDHAALLDAVTAVVASAWARAKVFPGA